MATDAPQTMDTAPRDGSVISASLVSGSTVDVWWDHAASEWLTDDPYDDTGFQPEPPYTVDESILSTWRPAG